METHDMKHDELKDMTMLEALQEARVFAVGDDDMFGLHLYELCDENFGLNHLSTDDIRRLANELIELADSTDKELK